MNKLHSSKKERWNKATRVPLLGTAPVFPFTFLAGVLLLAQPAEAITKYRVGAAGGSFGANANWSTTSGRTNDTTAPGSADVATFDGSGRGR